MGLMTRFGWPISCLVGLILAMAGAAGAADAGPTCRTQSKRVEATIAAVARHLKAQEYCQFRQYYTLDDVDGDGKNDFIVLFSVEGMGGGGNDHADFMAVFLSGQSWRPITVKTGGRGERDPISAEVRDHRIILATRVYRPEDPLCCPSGNGTVTYEVHGTTLRLVAEHEEKATPAAPTEHEKTPVR